MTATDPDAATERSIRELERRLRMFLPPPLLADANAFSAAFHRWQSAEHWRCIPPAPNVIAARREGDPPDPHADELGAARKACEAASSKHHHRREDHE